jgi:hypothetical protein
MNLLQRYERHRKWTAWFLLAIGILLAFLIVIFPKAHTLTIGAPVIIALVGLAVHCMFASGKAAS